MNLDFKRRVDFIEDLAANLELERASLDALKLTLEESERLRLETQFQKKVAKHHKEAEEFLLESLARYEPEGKPQ